MQQKGKAMIISLEEARLRRDIKKAEEHLSLIRVYISDGEYDKVPEAIELEALISDLENSLIKLIESELELPPPDDF
jgi:predicted esterase